MGNKQGKNGGCHDGRRGAVFNYFGQFAQLVANLPQAGKVNNGKGLPTILRLGMWVNLRTLPTIPRVSLPTIVEQASFGIVEHLGIMVGNPTRKVLGNNESPHDWLVNNYGLLTNNSKAKVDHNFMHNE